jgi:hypothetical protein
MRRSAARPCVPSCGGRSRHKPPRAIRPTRPDAKDDREAGRPHRPAPILFEGVHEAFMAMRQQHDQPGGAVCLNAIGRLWTDDSLGNPMIRGTLRQNQRDPDALKASQTH